MRQTFSNIFKFIPLYYSVCHAIRAAAADSAAAVCALVAAGAELDKVTSTGSTALHLAAASGALHSTRILLYSILLCSSDLLLFTPLSTLHSFTPSLFLSASL